MYIKKILYLAPLILASSTLIAGQSRLSDSQGSCPCKTGELYVKRVIGGWKETSCSNKFGLCINRLLIQNDIVDNPSTMGKTSPVLNHTAMYKQKAAAAANTYHVKIDGDDGNPCSEDFPCRTIQHGIDRLSSGDTLIVGAGNYDEFFIMSGDISGTSWSAPTTVMTAPGETVIIRGFSLGFSFSPASYMVIDGFVVDGEGAGVNAGNHVRMQNLEIMNVNYSGAAGAAYSGDYCEFINLKIHDVAWPLGQNKCDNGEAPDGYCHGIYVGSESVLIDGGEFYHCNGWGLHLRLGPHNNVVRNTRIHDNGSGGIIETSGGNLYYNNLIFNNGVPDAWGGIAVSGGSSVYNNTICNNRGAGGIYSRDYGNNRIRNNIVYGNDNNIQIDVAVEIEPDHNLTEDPMFVDAAAGDFHLRAGSPAIDAGVSIGEVATDISGTIRPQGSACDIGAYEYAGDMTDAATLHHPNGRGSTKALHENISIFDVRGKLVKRISGRRIAAAPVTWDGKDRRGNRVANGLYLILSTDGSYEVRSRLLIGR